MRAYREPPQTRNQLQTSRPLARLSGRNLHNFLEVCSPFPYFAIVPCRGCLLALVSTRKNQLHSWRQLKQDCHEDSNRCPFQVVQQRQKYQSRVPHDFVLAFSASQKTCNRSIVVVMLTMFSPSFFPVMPFTTLPKTASALIFACQGRKRKSPAVAQ